MVVLALVLVVMAVVAIRTSRGQLRAGSAGVALAVGAVVLLLTFGLMGARQRRAEPPAVSFLAPLADTTISNPVTIEVVVEHTGHAHPHVTIDEPCVRTGNVIPADNVHLHLGGERSWTLDLPPGPHTLCAQMGDRQHRAMAEDDRTTFVVK